MTNCGVKSAKAPAITNIAAAPPRLPVMASIATDNTVNAPAKVTKLLPISSQDIPLSESKALLNTNNDALITDIPTPTETNLAPDSNLDATPSIVNAPDKLTIPLAIFSQLNLPIESIALDITNIAAEMTVNPAPVAISPRPPPPSLENIDNSSSTAPTLAKPLINSSVSILPNSLTA